MEIKIKSLESIDVAAKDFLNKFSTDRFFAFYGEMGSGKTTFIRALCRQLETVDDTNSPTFSIVNEYFSKSNGVIYHFDFYRINKIEEVMDIGFEEYLQSSNYCFIEWPEVIEQILPDDFVKIRITEQGDMSRKISRI